MFHFHFSTSLFGYDREQVLSHLYKLQTGRDQELNELQKEIDRVKLENDFLTEKYEQLNGKIGGGSLDPSVMKFAVEKAGEFVSAVNEAAGREIAEIENEGKQAESEYDHKIRNYSLAMEQLEKRLIFLLQNALQDGETFSDDWEEIPEWKSFNQNFGIPGMKLDPADAGRTSETPESDRRVENHPDENAERREALNDEAGRLETGEEKAQPEADANLDRAKNKYMLNKITGKDLTDEKGEVIIPKDTVIDDDVIAKADSMGKLAELIINMTLPSIPA